MSDDPHGRLRLARPEDAARLVSLWELMFVEMGTPQSTSWQDHALAWIARSVPDGASTRIPVIEVAGGIVASAVGTVEVGVPNPHSPDGDGVRLANIFTLPAHRGRGYAAALVEDVVGWAQELGVDRIDLSATPDGQRTYERLGFTLASAPRMKRML